jgi:hypothetical protein
MFNRNIICLIIFFSFILSPSVSIEPVCKWYGIAPFCFIGNSCPENCWQVTANERGDGATCWFSQKIYCCCVKQAVDSIINSIVNLK